MTSPPPLAKDSHIIIVGAGIFGLSTSLHLAQRGYTNITVFDKQPYHKTLYSYDAGCDSASSDINKIIRSAYGSQTEYQDLSTEALSAWAAWNEELKSSTKDDALLPPGMTSSDIFFIQNGHLTCSDADTLPEFERATVENMELAGHHGTQLINNEQRDIKLASQQGLASALQPFDKHVLGVLDTTGGFVLADKACRFALHKAKRLGVRFILGPESGRLTSFIHRSSASPSTKSTINGIVTADGKSHSAALTILCCGGWTPSLLPSLDSLCETTAGSVFMLHIPESSPLRKRFHRSRFPSWSFNMRGHGADGGLYGFPVDQNGVLKIGYRGTKYTNPQVQSDGRERSVPVTRWTSNDAITQVPQQAHQAVTKFLQEYLPELGNAGIYIAETRLCWYTDSFDNHYVIDRVPRHEGLMCATGGSGHAFKFLPSIGSWVVDVMEGVGLDRPAIKAWRWRTLQEGEEPVNKLMEGSQGPRSLWNVPLVSV
ncbi:sarcosine oxidase / L-pipecolate oxidase [Trichoderma asperellum]|nr:FAD dependent oxidoreductase [Trichoderma asperelloides]